MTIHRNHRAFTLLEMIVVLGILALLATLLITKTEGIFGRGQETVAKVFVRDSLKTALERYRMDLGSYPTTAEGLAVLVTAPANAAGNWHGPYTDPIPPDPWGQPYQYRCPGTRNKSGYDLFSKGIDKTEGTDDDIGNW
ncbi:MAG: type II secretion system major pseudopilin GspG [Verrucomicrobiota bacterium]